MSRWPPAIWLCISVGSLLVLVGVGGDWNPEGFFPGLALLLLGFGLGLYLAYGRPRERPVPRGVAWLVPAAVAFYVAAAVAASMAGSKYVMIALAASLVPVTAAALIVATVRVKTESGDDDHEDPFPGMGADDETPLGDTREHSRWQHH